MRCLVDLSETIESDGVASYAHGLFSTVLEKFPEVRSASRTVLIVRNPDHFSEFRADIVKAKTADEAANEATVLDELGKLVEEAVDNEEPVIIFSFSPRVKLQVTTEASLQSSQTRFIDLREVIRKTPAMEALTTWPTDFMPLEQALKAVRQAIVKQGGSLKQTQLRPALVAVNTAFRKDPGRNAVSDNPKFISLIVREASDNGLIELQGSSADPLLKLRNPAPLVHVDETAEHEAIMTAEPALPAASLSRVTEGNRESDRYLDLLRKHHIGPFQEVRIAIYDAIEAALDGSQPVTIRSLLSDSVQKVRDEIDDGRKDGRLYLIKSMDRNMPWGRVRGFITLLMSRAPVLLSGEEALSASWTNLNHDVDGLAEDWRLKLDSQLICFLLEHGCLLGIYSEEDLAGALYNDRSKTSEVQDCFAYLDQSGLCTVDALDLTIHLVGG
jgi:hypothetical protein